jgi:hypothetical protein
VGGTDAEAAVMVIPNDTPVVIRAWREKRDGTFYDNQVAHCRFADLPARIERYWGQRRYAVAVLKTDDDQFGDEPLEVGRVFKHQDTGRWTWWSDGPRSDGAEQ